MYPDIFVYVPDFKHILRIAEGDGMNLLDEDIEKGFVDYIYYDQHELNTGLEEIDGGQIMLEKPFHEQFASMAECIPRVLQFAYGNWSIRYIVLK